MNGIKVHKTSLSFLLTAGLIAVLIYAAVFFDVLHKNQQNKITLLLLITSAFAYIFILLLRFKIEIHGTSLHYRKLLYSREIKVAEIAYFSLGAQKSPLSRNLALEIQMKPGVKPQKHRIGFYALSIEGQSDVLSFFKSNRINENHA